MNEELEVMVRKFLMEGAYTKEGGLTHKIKARLRSSSNNSKHHSGAGQDDGASDHHVNGGTPHSPAGGGGGGGGFGSRANSGESGEGAADAAGDGQAEEIPIRILMSIMDEVYVCPRRYFGLMCRCF